MPPQFPHSGHSSALSLLHGWVPTAVEVAAVSVLVMAVGWRSLRWRILWVPICVVLGLVGAVVARWYLDAEGLASDPAPLRLWVWIAVSVAAVGVLIFGWRRTRWWRRGLSVLAVPACVLCTAIVLNQWVGYFPTVQSAWGAVTAGPLPDQVDASQLPALRGTPRSTGAVVPIDVPDDVSDFSHRTEYVYLPPAWFTGATPPALPAVLMIAGEFNTPADWVRSGNSIPAVDDFARQHGGQSPILVFADAGGSFNNDTECVNGPRGNSADHLTREVRPYVTQHFGAASDAHSWGVVGWSMGGTCAVDLTVMHPDLFTSFVDIAGDSGPSSGTKDQTVAHLYGGDANAWARFDPTTVMTTHGAYTGVSGLFADTGTPQRRRPSRPQTQPDETDGLGGHDAVPDNDEAGAAQRLCATGKTVAIDCTIDTMPGGHTWQFASHALTVALPWLQTRL